MMKRIYYYLALLFLLLLFPGCAEMLNPGGMADERLLASTKGAVPEYYYWYGEEQIPLKICETYVNILLDTVLVKKSGVPGLCADLGLIANTVSL